LNDSLDPFRSLNRLFITTQHM